MWKAILDKYEVSDCGDIRNAKTGRIVKQFVGEDGYLRTQIAGKTRLVHRLVALAFVPAEPNKDFVNHKDGNKQNCRADNLKWCTRSENQKHAYAHSLKEPLDGERNGRHKLSYEDVDFILKHYTPRDRVYGAKALAKRFGVAHQTICAVVSGQNWKKSVYEE